MSRFVLAIAVIAVLLAAIIYSQMRTSPAKVSGVVEADEIRLGSRVGGRVQDVQVTEGAAVKADQVLVTFEPYDLEQREQVAAAELAMREAELKKLEAGLRDEEIAQAKAHYERLLAQYELVVAGPRDEEIAAAERRMDAATAVKNLAQQNYDRVSKLLQDNSVSRRIRSSRLVARRCHRSFVPLLCNPG